MHTTRREDAFSGCHPLVNLLYFLLILIFSLCRMHPGVLLLSLTAALCCSLLGRRGGAGLSLSPLFLLPLPIFAALVNPLFNHRGVTVLAWLPTGNPLTLESLIYGLMAGLLLAAVLCWFLYWNRVVSTDKFLYLFGRILPALSLVFSMIFRFLPRFRSQLQRVADAQRCLGRDPAAGDLHQRAKNGIALFSILMTWALENGVETADAMKSRGYGLPGRTAFSLYRLTRRDKGSLVILALLGAFQFAGLGLGALQAEFFPRLVLSWGLLDLAQLIAFGILAFFPIFLHGKEVLAWKRSASNL